MESQSRSRRKIILGSLLVLLCGTLAVSILGNSLALVQKVRNVSNSGSVKGIGVGVYWNPICTNLTSSIGWGVLDPGSNKTVTVYIKNRGNSLATLSIATQNWNPPNASSYLTLTWDYAGQTLSSNQIQQIKLTLAVSSVAPGTTDFSFDTLIIATG